MLDKGGEQLRKNRTEGGIRTTNNNLLRNSMPSNPFDNSGDEDDYEEDDPDFSAFDEPVIIRLMANMFSQKKVVQEFLPEINLDKLKKELYETRLR